jgi:site-specific recombinase XerC
VLLLTLRYTGLRMKELVNLRTEEVDLEARRISLVGKGRKPRVVPFPPAGGRARRRELIALIPALSCAPVQLGSDRGS